MELEEIQQRMHSGRLYYNNHPELVRAQEQAMELNYDFNATRPSQGELRQQILKELLGDIGEDCYITQPFHVCWGRHVHMGNKVYANLNLTLVDDTHIYIGDHVMFGPNVIVCTATHPVSTELRRKKAEYNLPIHIGENVWVGGGVFIMPGITIGENSIIGANSVVTHDVPANVIAAGNPCRVLRPICDRDREFYNRDCPIDID